MKIFCLGSNSLFTRKVAFYLGIELGKVNVSKFSDGEIFIEIGENVRGEDCFLVQTLYPNSSEAIMTLVLAADTLKRASAGRVTAVIPYFAYMRQDRKVRPRVPISFKALANILVASGIDRVLTMDLHKGQLAGFFDIPVDNLLPHPVMIPYFKERLVGKNVVVVSPDAGGVERAKSILDPLGFSKELCVIYKHRDFAGTVSTLGLAGNVKNRIALIVDDIIDTCGTIKKAIDLLTEKGAVEVVAFATHGLFSGKAFEVLTQIVPHSVVVTNTIQKTVNVANLIVELDVSGLFAEAIKRIHTNTSVSELFKW